VSNVVFPFTLSRPYREHRLTITSGADLGGGISVRSAEVVETPGWIFSAMFDLRLPRDSQTVDTWDDWIQSRSGAKDTFLFKAARTQNKTVTGATLTGTVNGVNKVFTVSHKYLDAASVIVYRDASPDASYTLSLNNTTPTITYITAPSSSATIDFDFYYPVWFETDPPEAELLSGGATSATVPHIVRAARVVEQYGGAHLV
jgi:hypothetical protein